MQNDNDELCTEEITSYLSQQPEDYINTLLSHFLAFDNKSENELTDLLKQTSCSYIEIFTAILQRCSDNSFSRHLPLEEKTLGQFAHTLLKKLSGGKLVLADIDLTTISREQWHLLGCIAYCKDINLLDLSNCRLHALTDIHFNYFCELLLVLQSKELSLGSNCFSKLSSQQLQSFLTALGTNSPERLNLADNFLGKLSHEQLQVVCEFLPRTQIKYLNLAMNNLHQLSAENIHSLFMAIAKSDIRELHLTGNPLEKLDEAQWQALLAALKTSKITKLTYPLKKLDQTRITELEASLTINLQRSFVESWGAGLRGLVLHSLANKGKTPGELLSEVEPQSSPEGEYDSNHSLFALFSQIDNYHNLGIHPPGNQGGASI
ncbi:hypothetical protein [Legionella spiritensis]|uniref:Leucine-rich repeat protein substrate of the Dot/Icm secretion system n=1 Tax=Legionella spiritensis TaxID=452 RepID=A0A0W0YWL4_LEGSP|nr:hypothetical protein [Legionella spiritensis]KTD61227.1 Leucine-rich repeat protein substrate of the Dot/Icm secretion system [Legionella spiritensis]SNV28086.1 leucine-rich repeat-containing protein [Legionella spiritensis]